MVTVSEKAWRLSMNSSVSRMFLGVGQQVSVNDLLYGLMLSSGNDAAVALAEYLDGSTDGFTEQMNREARKLGLNETHFENPDGLPARGTMFSPAGVFDDQQPAPVDKQRLRGFRVRRPL
jgi:D-alanyl-D-alanine carboxypeptidase (penicillin-binding protein 5/6)